MRIGTKISEIRVTSRLIFHTEVTQSVTRVRNLTAEHTECAEIPIDFLCGLRVLSVEIVFFQECLQSVNNGVLLDIARLPAATKVSRIACRYS